MTDITLTIQEPPDETDLNVVHDGLRAFNARHAESPRERPFLLTARDPAEAVVGGLDGALLWHWLYVKNLWVADEHRGHGVGSRLLEAAEAFARERGGTAGFLDTMDFQARPFYERHGYRVFGVLDGFPPGGRRFYMEKRFPRPAGP